MNEVKNARYLVAATFGNVHGVYKPGHVKLKPSILKDGQQALVQAYGEEGKFYFVFHGGSGSSLDEIREALDYGVVKMNIDTDTQWSYWEGIKNFEAKYHDYLQTQIGNPEGDDKPNKKYYDVSPRHLSAFFDYSYDCILPHFLHPFEFQAS